MAVLTDKQVKYALMAAGVVVAYLVLTKKEGESFGQKVGSGAVEFVGNVIGGATEAVANGVSDFVRSQDEKRFLAAVQAITTGSLTSNEERIALKHYAAGWDLAFGVVGMINQGYAIYKARTAVVDFRNTSNEITKPQLNQWGVYQ